MVMAMGHLKILCGFALSAALAAWAAGPTFDAASVKPAAPMQEGKMLIRMSGGPGTPDPTNLVWTNVSLINILTRAFDVKSYQVTGSSAIESQLNGDRYDISAKIPAGTSKADFLLMAQNLLAERFHLVLHHDSKEVQGYELVVAKGGSKLKESSPEDRAFDPEKAGPSAPPTRPPGGGPPTLDRPGTIMMMRVGPNGNMLSTLTYRGQPVSALAEALASQLGKPVVDKTGLTSKYDYTLEYTPDSAVGMMAGGMALPPMPRPEGAPASPGAPTSLGEMSGPSLVTAVQEQLGLRLESKKVPVDLLVIEKIDKTPTEN